MFSVIEFEERDCFKEDGLFKYENVVESLYEVI